MGDVSEKQQKIVYFDVGGTVFRVFRDTIQNYPSSLLAKLICEFPNLGEEAKPLFVDRSPKAFEWILEIYRNGDYASCVPAVSREALKRELDFYQLPGFADLGLLKLGHFSQAAEAAYEGPGKLLFEALTERNVWNSLPIYVWFYRMCRDYESEFGKELVWFSEQPSGHTLLFEDTNGTPLYVQADALQHEQESSWVSRRDYEPGGGCYMIRNPNVPDVCRFLQQSVEEYGVCLRLPERSWGQSEMRTYGFPPGLIVTLAQRNR